MKLTISELGNAIKTCAKCKVEKSASQFGLHKKSRDGLRNYCKECWNAYKHEWRIHNRENFDAHQKKSRDKRLRDGKYQLSPSCMQKRHRLLRLYGMTQLDFDELVEKQDGRCACCGRIPEYLVIDHDHATGNVRGLLCCKCNLGIGLVGDTQSRLQLAADYLSGVRHVCM